ncbi:DUF58 domain-containing protein [Infirmifilum sp. SLHALR2]|nr:MAG: hypothetical protein B7L53_09240 [Thermofilum sp. NZ13]
MRINLSDRGFAFTAMLLFLWASALILRDRLLALIGAGASLPLLLDFARLVRSSRGLVLDVRGSPLQEVWVWERPGFEVVAGGSFEPVGLPKWLRVSGVEARGKVLLYRFEAVFRHSGVYSLEALVVKVSSRLGFFELLEEFPVGLSFRVKPATLFWLQQALALLGIGEGLRGRTPRGVLPQVIYSRFIPEEYAGSREYWPGDNLKFIDWKATARRQKLFVKEFREGAGSQPMLTFDTRCLGPYTCDAVASAVLSLAVGLAAQGVGASGVYDVESGRLLAFSSPHGVLAYIVNRVLESKVADELDLYEFIEPPTFYELRRVLKEIAGLSLRFECSSLAKVLSHGNIVYATALLHNTSEVLDLASSVSTQGGTLTLVMPAEPWLDARSEAVAGVVKASFRRILGKLSSTGARVLLCGEGAPGMLVVKTSA